MNNIAAVVVVVREKGRGFATLRVQVTRFNHDTTHRTPPTATSDTGPSLADPHHGRYSACCQRGQRRRSCSELARLLWYVLYSCTVHGPASFRHSYLQLIHSPHHPSYNPLDHLNILILYNDDYAREGTQGHANTTEAERPQCPQNTRTRRSA